MAERKTTLVRKSYRFDDGTTGRSAKPTWKDLVFEILAPTKDENDNAVVLETISVARDQFPADLLVCAMGHGLSQKIGDDLAGIASKAAKEEPPFQPDPVRGYADYAYDRIAAMVENLVAGVWVEEGEGSSSATSVTILFEAIERVLVKAGKDITDANRAERREKLKDKTFRESVAKRPDVAEQVAAIKFERAQERHLAAQAKAAEAGAPSLDDLA